MSDDRNLCSGEISRASHLLPDSALFICHELRTPLTSIQGALGLLNSGKLGDLSKEGQQLLTIAINNAERLTRLACAIENKPSPELVMLSDDMIEQLQLENALYDAINRQSFDLVYQPIVSAKTNQILGFEALARWQHPTRGAISPEIFIPLAEKNHCIYPLGLWILEQACQQLRVWQQQFPSIPALSMSVNLSALQLLNPELIPAIQKILEKTRITASSLKLEITESALIEDHQIAISTLIKLQAMGIQLYVDDFGTGYSSLGRLQDLPIDVLKIDRSFIKTQQWDISATIILLADRLGLDVIAEGVETEGDRAALLAAGCTKMQGYHFSKPLDSPSATSFLQLFCDAREAIETTETTKTTALPSPPNSLNSQTPPDSPNPQAPPHSLD